METQRQVKLKTGLLSDGCHLKVEVNIGKMFGPHHFTPSENN